MTFERSKATVGRGQQYEMTSKIPGSTSVIVGQTDKKELPSSSLNKPTNIVN